MPAVWLRSRAELRARWPALLALTLLVGIAGGAVLAALAGARRTSSSYDRFVEESRSAHVFVILFHPIPAGFVEEVRRLREVEGFAHLDGLVVQAKGTDEPLGSGSALDDGFAKEVDRPRVLEGRLPEENAVREVAVGERTAAALGVDLGGLLILDSYTPEQVEAAFAEETPSWPEGPTIRMRVVGLLRSPIDLNTGRDLSPVVFTQAFQRRYQGEIGSFGEAVRIRLRGGDEAVPAFIEKVRGLAPPGTDADFTPLSFESGRVNDSIDVLAAGLLVFGVVVAAAGLVAVAQAVGRHVFVAATEQTALRALGMGRVERTLALGVPLVTVAAGGAVLAFVAALGASPFLPIGLARQAEPDPGVSLDGLVLGAGAATIAIVVAMLAAVAAWRTARLVDREEPRIARPASTALVGWLARSGFRAPAVTGVRMGLQPGRGRSAVPVRSALAGAGVAVAGVVAVLVFGASFDRLRATPRLYGWNWDAVENSQTPDLDTEELAADPNVVGLAAARVANLRIEGQPVEGVGLDQLRGSVVPTILEGREARGPDEVVLGDDTMREGGAHVGGTVRLEGPDGAGRFRVVGRGVYPAVEVDDVVAEGAVFTEEGLLTLVDRGGTSSYVIHLVDFAADVDETSARRIIGDAGGDAELAEPPAEVGRLEQVNRLPLVLGAFLALLGVLAVGHALVLAVRRRRRDLAVLRTLGFDRGQVRTTVLWQSGTIALVGLVGGIPIGLAVGRWAWTLLAGSLGVEVSTAVPLLALLLGVPATFLVAMLVAAWPAHAAARLRPAETLRAE
jgi:hypothetical protein